MHTVRTRSDLRRRERNGARPGMGARALLAALAVAVASVVAPVADLPAGASGPNAGTVRTWNANALAALGAAGQPPNVAVLHMAMVQGAVYDAVNSIDGGHEPYLDGLPTASPDASMEAAVAALFLALAAGLLFGYYPAHRSSELDPIEALRFES